MSESWSDIRAQVDAQIKTINFIDKYGRIEYRRVCQIRNRYNHTINYRPKQGVNVEGLWSTFEATFELEQCNSKKIK